MKAAEALAAIAANGGDLFAAPAPEPLVPAEHFTGCELERRRFAFYGETFDLPDPIDWEHNPGSDHWGHDLNRFGFLVLFDDAPQERARAAAMKALIFDWIARNGETSPKRSRYAWGNLLNIAIRLENWWRFLGAATATGAIALSAEERDLILRCAYKHIVVLARLMRRRGYEDNWTFLGARGGLYVVAALTGMPRREFFARLFLDCVRRAVARQVLPDGAHHELSPHYHWVTLELLHSIAGLADAAGAADADAFGEPIERMANLLKALMCPDGSIVALGDSDADYGPRIGAFLARLEARRPNGPIAVRRAEVFPYAGIAALRQPETDSLLVFDAGPFGIGHQHEDKLGFWFTAHGRNLIVDPGRYLYEKGEDKFYAYLRSARAHSTILIDGFGQNARARPETWRAAAPLDDLAIEETASAIVLTGRYELGFGPDCIRVVHERRLVWTGTTLRVEDSLLGDGARTIEARFQIAPCAWTLDAGVFSGTFGAVRLDIRVDPVWTEAAVDEGRLDPKSGWYSSGLNKLAPSPTLRLTARAALPFRSAVEIAATALN